MDTNRVDQTSASSNLFYNSKYGVSMADILKYILEGIAVSTAAFFISPKNRKDYKSIIVIGLSAALIFFIIDKFAPKVSAGARQGSGFGIGFGLVGGGTGAGAGVGTGTGNKFVVEETYVAETPTSISLNDRTEKYYDYGSARGNQPLVGNGKPSTVIGVSDFDDSDSTVDNEGFNTLDILDDNMSQKKETFESNESEESFDSNDSEDADKAQSHDYFSEEKNSIKDVEGFENSSKQTSWYPIGNIFKVADHNSAVY